MIGRRRSPAETRLFWACITAALAGMDLILATRDLAREQDDADGVYRLKATSIQFEPATVTAASSDRPAVTDARYDYAELATDPAPVAQPSEPDGESRGQVPSE